MAAGFQISVLTESAIRFLLNRQLTPEALEALGRYGESLVRKDSLQSFVKQADPSTGKAWAPLKYARKRGETANAQILLNDRYLYRAVGSTHQVSGAAVTILGGIYPLTYGTIHQFGGRTRPHEIRAVKARALFWRGASGQKVFARSVNHPGSVIPARPYVGISPQSLSAFGQAVQRYWTNAQRPSA
jgi:phage gpG-like protein